MRFLLVPVLCAVLLVVLVLVLVDRSDDSTVRVRTTTDTTAPTDSWSTFTAPSTTAVVRLVPRARTAPTVVAEAVYTGDMPVLIRSVFGRFGADVGEEAVRVSHCETVGTFDPHSTGDAGERGLMQIHPVHKERIARMGFTWDQMYEPGPNLEVAAAIYAESGWRPWTCRSAA